ncbi:hypothetical protein D3C73_1471270 [compost metagenome]
MSAAIGRIVHYKLADSDALAINNRRIKEQSPGNTVWPGDVFPAMIVRRWGDTPESSIQLQVFLDGHDTHWATSRTEGEGEGQWFWPPRS